MPLAVPKKNFHFLIPNWIVLHLHKHNYVWACAECTRTNSVDSYNPKDFAQKNERKMRTKREKKRVRRTWDYKCGSWKVKMCKRQRYTKSVGKRWKGPPQRQNNKGENETQINAINYGIKFEKKIAKHHSTISKGKKINVFAEVNEFTEKIKHELAHKCERRGENNI